MYSVSKFVSIETSFGPLLEHINYPCLEQFYIVDVITSSLYQYFRAGLKFEGGFVEDLLRFRLVELFQSDDDVKGQIISSFTLESPLRIVCAMVYFGMGLDCTMSAR